MRATGDTSIDVKRTRRQFVLAIVGLTATLALTAVSFYLLDGSELVTSLAAEYSDLWSQPDTAPDSPSGPSTGPALLQLPEGMPEEFALRIWQEQVDSQQNILKLLIDEEVSSVSVDSTRTLAADRREAGITAHFRDGTSMQGTLVATKFGDVWYLASVTARRSDGSDGVGESAAADPTTALPSLEEVDVAALNTIIGALEANTECTEEIMDGVIREIVMDSVTVGARTRTVKATMKEGSEDVSVELIGIRVDDDGRDLWLCAGFREL